MASGTGKAEGQGFTVSFAVLAIILNLLDVNITGPSVTSINCSDQSTTGFEEYIASTLKEGGNYTFNIQWNLEDQVRNKDLSDEQIGVLKRRIDYLNSKCRPRIVAGLGEIFAKAVKEGNEDLVKEPDLKDYKAR